MDPITPIITLLAPYGLPGIIIGYLLWDNKTTKKAMLNGMMTVVKDNTEIMTGVKSSIESNTKALERLERMHERNV